jgi:hypothetical protein
MTSTSLETDAREIEVGQCRDATDTDVRPGDGRHRNCGESLASISTVAEDMHAIAPLHDPLFQVKECRTSNYELHSSECPAPDTVSISLTQSTSQT